MKKSMIVVGGIFTLCLVGGGIFYGFSMRSKAQIMPKVKLDGKTIVITENGFTPESLTVSAGSTIKFVNSDTYWHWPASDPHPSHTFYSELDPKQPIKPGTTWEVTLTKAGKWGIHDHLAPYVIGTITVTQ